MSEPLATPPSEIQRVVFLGTPPLSAVALRALVDAGFDVPLVVSRPDRRRGRGSKATPSPVKAAAMELGLATSDDLADVAEVEADIAVVVAYGRIIPVSLLNRLAMVNIHFSLLPRWRGAAPVERAILAGDARTGVCLMEVAEGLDEGGVYARAETEIGPDETADELRERLGQLGAELLVTNLSQGLPPAEPQHGTVTYAAKLDKDEARLDFSQPAEVLHRRVRVGRAWAEFRGKRLGIERTAVHQPTGDQDTEHPGRGRELAAGQLLLDGRRAYVATAEGLLELIAVKPEGKRATATGDWINGVRPEDGERLD